jgi:hypothetical protein
MLSQIISIEIFFRESAFLKIHVCYWSDFDVWIRLNPSLWKMIVEFRNHSKHVLQLTLLYFLFSIHARLAASANFKRELVVYWQKRLPSNILLDHPSELALNHTFILLVKGEQFFLGDRIEGVIIYLLRGSTMDQLYFLRRYLILWCHNFPSIKYNRSGYLGWLWILPTAYFHFVLNYS